MAAITIVDATVVAPVAPAATMKGMSRRLTLVTLRPVVPSTSISAGVKPALSRPLMMAMVAGTAPCLRTSASTSSAVATFCGYGMPCEMMVDSRATTGLLCASASATSGWMSR